MRIPVLIIALIATATCVDAQRALPFAEPETAVSESYVMLSSGDLLYGEVKTHPESGVPQFFTVNGERFDRRQVVQYAINGVDYGLYHGGGSQPLLLIKASNGNVNVFDEVSYSTGATFFQHGSGPIQLASSQNLRAAFVGHEPALRHLQREHRLNYVGYGAFAAGAALVAAGTVVELNNVEGANGIMIAASGVALAVAVNAIVPMLQQGHRNAAIRAYNGQ